MNKTLKTTALIATTILLFFACENIQKKTALKGANGTENAEDSTQNTEQNAELRAEQDKQQIQTLIRAALKWGEESEIALPSPVTAEGVDVCVNVGLNMKEHTKNLAKMRESGFFSREFIANYNNLITTLDQRLSLGDITWMCGEQQSFNFAQDHGVWIAAQDLPYYDPEPFEIIEMQTVQLDGAKGEFYWKWAAINGMGQATKSALEDGKQRFEAVKEDGKWKISYLETFDYENAIKFPTSADNKDRHKRGRTLDENDVRNLGDRFVTIFKTKDLDALTALFAPSYLEEVGEKYYGGTRQNQFFREFLAGTNSSDEFIVPKSLDDVATLWLVNPYINTYRGFASAKFVVKLKSGKFYTVDLRMPIENGKVYFDGGRG